MTEGGRYFLCDRCEQTTFSLNLPWNRDGETIAAAKQAGWRIGHDRRTGSKGEDVCPVCIAIEIREGTV